MFQIGASAFTTKQLFQLSVTAKAPVYLIYNCLVASFYSPDWASCSKTWSETTLKYFFFQGGCVLSPGRRRTGRTRSPSRTTRRRSCNLWTCSTRGCGGRQGSATSSCGSRQKRSRPSRRTAWMLLRRKPELTSEKNELKQSSVYSPFISIFFLVMFALCQFMLKIEKLFLFCQQFTLLDLVSML